MCSSVHFVVKKVFAADSLKIGQARKPVLHQRLTVHCSLFANDTTSRRITPSRQKRWRVES